jgi:hypothetical protein
LTVSAFVRWDGRLRTNVKTAVGAGGPDTSSLEPVIIAVPRYRRDMMIEVI